MEKTILFLSNGKSFMINAIEKNIADAGYKIISLPPEIKDISTHQKEADIIVFYLGSFVADITDTLVYLKDICTEEDKLLILIGNKNELAAVDEHIPPALVADRFERPIDMKKIVGELDRLLAANDANARRKSILLVDDDGTFLKMVKSWLSAKYRVTIVTSGTQALMYIADNKPDLILLDYEMPVTSGPQVLEMIRSESRLGKIPVIFLTGRDDRESVLKVLALKPDGYLLKNTNRDALVAAVDEFFEKQKYSLLHEQGNHN